MAIREWPEQERPREKLMKSGAAALSDAELLAIFLRTGTRGETAVDVARRLLKKFSGLRGILEAQAQVLCAETGLGAAKCAQLLAVTEMARRHLGEQLQAGSKFTDSKTTGKFLLASMRHYRQEVFACLYLDSQHRLIHFQKHFFGTINGASVHPRELVKTALQYHAAAVVLAHNHPSGIAEPSQADRDITQRIKAALGLVDVRLLDHMVVGDAEVVSFAERGLLDL